MKLRVLAACCALGAVALPAAAFADKSTKGNKVLDVEVTMKPAKTSTQNVRQGTAVSYTQELTTTSGDRPSQDVSDIRITFPIGFVFNVKAFPQCKFSAVDKASANNGDPSKGCPAKALIGTGSASIDARPTVSGLIPATVKGFAGVDDEDLQGKPRKPVPAIILTASAKVGGATVYSYFAADVLFDNVLDVPFPPSTGPSLYVIRKLTLNLRNLTGRGGSPLIQTPNLCKKSWTVTQATKFSDKSSVSASDKVPCTQAK